MNQAAMDNATRGDSPARLPPGIRLEADGIFQDVPQRADKWLLAFMLAVVMAMAIWDYVNQTPFMIPGAVLSLLFLAIQCFKVCWLRFHPRYRRGRPLLRHDAETHQLIFWSLQRWPAQQAVSLSPPPRIVVSGPPYARQYHLEAASIDDLGSTAAVGQKKAAVTIDPKWPAKVAPICEAFLRRLNETGLIASIAEEEQAWTVLEEIRRRAGR